MTEILSNIIKLISSMTPLTSLVPHWALVWPRGYSKCWHKRKGVQGKW